MTRILSLDDDPEILELIQLVLTRAGYEVLTATNAQQALVLLQSQAIDLLTQDISRPGIRGDEFLRQMKSDETLRQIPVVVISAVPYHSVKQALAERGLDVEHDLAGYLPLPFGPKQLLNTIAAILPQHGAPLPPANLQGRSTQKGPEQPNQARPPATRPPSFGPQSTSLCFAQRWARLRVDLGLLWPQPLNISKV